MSKNRTEYNRIHKWAERHMVKTRECSAGDCDFVGRTQWSNIDHQYRQDPTEWQELCPACHHEFDIEMGLKSKSTGRKPGSKNIQTLEPRLLTYLWYSQDEIDSMKEVCILIEMRDNVYIKQKYFELWRELKAQGRVPELIEGILKAELKKRATKPLNKPKNSDPKHSS